MAFYNIIDAPLFPNLTGHQIIKIHFLFTQTSQRCPGVNKPLGNTGTPPSNKLQIDSRTGAEGERRITEQGG
jgi:hypothetical protein